MFLDSFYVFTKTIIKISDKIMLKIDYNQNFYKYPSTNFCKRIINVMVIIIVVVIIVT